MSSSSSSSSRGLVRLLVKDRLLRSPGQILVKFAVQSLRGPADREVGPAKWSGRCAVSKTLVGGPKSFASLRGTRVDPFESFICKSFEEACDCAFLSRTHSTGIAFYNYNSEAGKLKSDVLLSLRAVLK